jgi:hypothetical protein
MISMYSRCIRLCSMNAETRQTLIGVVGLSLVEAVALLEGFNGVVLTAYFAAVIALVSPKALEQWRQSTNGGG